jgi:alkylation response protein AidB-like acyl-CoA dehydrogenase
VDLGAGGGERETLENLDPTRSQAQLVFRDAAAEPLGLPGEGWNHTRALLDRAAILFAFEQSGGAEAALDMARAYAMERYAFGRPIASFQAIKHKLADMYIAATLARSNCYYGAWALSTDAPELPLAAATARVSATRAFNECASENIQTHGGMGFTWEFDCHLYYRRAKALAVNLGSLGRWEDRLVAALESTPEAQTA